jgi:hypothetical protein
VVIKVNAEPIDFTLEKEAVLSDVVKGVQQWVGGSGFVVTEILMGGRDLLSLPRREWESTPIASASELDFRVSRSTDVRIEHWTAVRAWMGMLEREAAEPGASLEELAGSVPSTLASIRKNPFLPPGSQDLERLESLMSGQDASRIRQWPEDKKREAAALISRLGGALDARITEAAHPQEAVKAHLPKLRELHARMPDVPLLLQTGKDRQAMEIVAGFSELLQKLLDIVPFLPKDGEREKIFEELNPILKQVVTAFDAKDFVLIGDLFEYEIAPRLGRLVPLLDARV